MEKPLKAGAAELPAVKATVTHDLPTYQYEVTFESLEQLRSQTSKKDSLKPLTRCNFSGHTWVTDEHARPIYAGGELTAEGHGRVGKSLQTKIGNEGDYRATDVGFHLIGDQFGGPVSRLNVLQGNALLNNSGYKALENQLKNHVEAGRKVQVRIQAHYEGTSMRPSRFTVDYRVDGAKSQTKVFRNTIE